MNELSDTSTNMKCFLQANLSMLNDFDNNL